MYGHICQIFQKADADGILGECGDVRSDGYKKIQPCGIQAVLYIWNCIYCLGNSFARWTELRMDCAFHRGSDGGKHCGDGGLFAYDREEV